MLAFFIDNKMIFFSNEAVYLCAFASCKRDCISCSTPACPPEVVSSFTSISSALFAPRALVKNSTSLTVKLLSTAKLVLHPLTQWSILPLQALLLHLVCNFVNLYSADNFIEKPIRAKEKCIKQPLLLKHGVI